ncbi:hypothetical protein LRS03_26040 [Rhizobacter sp. J219]|uniref:hypothetical protein n=1 Tax=Rhizobacter sp. J219 TaxID=2898430 RepID=UPI002150999A|nr:hypothetical protein [Rhizobacter sp. J219]MCR5886127.1 hypothetical protein [Rhizobacter sp. J219]
MKLIACLLLAVSALVSGPAFAGKDYEGWGKTPQEAMDAALSSAAKNSRGGCLCKDWSPASLEEQCKASEKLGGYTCKACGSNHKGSCTDRTEIEKKLGIKMK